jgi:hypothetical protein
VHAGTSQRLSPEMLCERKVERKRVELLALRDELEQRSKRTAPSIDCCSPSRAELRAGQHTVGRKEPHHGGGRTERGVVGRDKRLYRKAGMKRVETNGVGLVYHQRDGWTGSNWVKTRREFAERAATERGGDLQYRTEDADTNYSGHKLATTPIRSRGGGGEVEDPLGNPPKEGKLKKKLSMVGMMQRHIGPGSVGAVVPAS